MVFSGIIEEIGSVVSLTKANDVALWDGSVGEGWVLVVAAKTALVGAYLGASIAVNGTCLTVTAFDDATFTVGLAPETCVLGWGVGAPAAAGRAGAGSLDGGPAGHHSPCASPPPRTLASPPAPRSVRRTNLSDLAPGSPVNLERALPADGRNSGHYVQGHVDGTGVIEVRGWVWVSAPFPPAGRYWDGVSRLTNTTTPSPPFPPPLLLTTPQSFTREGDSLWVRVGGVPPALLRHILPKGFIAVDGTSLTVCEVDPAGGWFNFMLIAHTQRHIALPSKAVGDRVNLEADVLGKYASQAADAAVARVEAAVAALQGALTARLDALASRLAALEGAGAKG